LPKKVPCQNNKPKASENNRNGSSDGSQSANLVHWAKKATLAPCKNAPMTFSDFIDLLQQQLTLPLPGAAAHEKMASAKRLQLNIAPNERTRRSAVLILLYQYQDQIYVPLILRPKYDGVHAGQMAFPGGRFEKTDENLLRTALREAQEEIGIKAADVQVLGSLTELYIPPSNFYVLPVVGKLLYRPEFYPDPREVERIFEVSLTEMADEGIIGQTEINIKGLKIEVPSYLIQEHKVWGATAMMISELLTVIDQSKALRF
jgi:8-oxo-dGTP pyrophosphatase MutT (NUDIX family)